MNTTDPIYLANNTIVKDGIVLGYQVGATIDGNIIEAPKETAPSGFMVRRSQFGDFDSAWNTKEAAEEKARRLNRIDGDNAWSVFA